MKKTNLFYSLLSIVSFSMQIGAMESDSIIMKTPQSVRITRALDAAPFRKLPSEILATYTGNNNRLPIMFIAESAQSFTKKELELACENLVKNNPSIAEQMENDLDLKDEFIHEMANKPMPTLIPASFLEDKKPNSIVMYMGSGTPDSCGFKISETAGNRVVCTQLLSSVEKDPFFIAPPMQMYVATEEFCKEVNKHMHAIEIQLRIEEQTEDGRRIMGDQFKITSGWNGGKSFMDTENRSVSIRPR